MLVPNSSSVYEDLDLIERLGMLRWGVFLFSLARIGNLSYI